MMEHRPQEGTSKGKSTFASSIIDDIINRNFNTIVKLGILDYKYKL